MIPFSDFYHRFWLHRDQYIPCCYRPVCPHNRYCFYIPRLDLDPYTHNFGLPQNQVGRICTQPCDFQQHIFNNTGCIVFAGYAIAWIFAGETNTSHISWATSIFEAN
jgi:hypothetical protein